MFRGLQHCAASVTSTEAGFLRRFSHAGCSDRASRAVVFLVRSCIEAWSHFLAMELLLDRRGGGVLDSRNGTVFVPD